MFFSVQQLPWWCWLVYKVCTKLQPSFLCPWSRGRTKLFQAWRLFSHVDWCTSVLFAIAVYCKCVYSLNNGRTLIFTSQTSLHWLNLHWLGSQGSASSARVPVSWERAGSQVWLRQGWMEMDEEAGTDCGRITLICLACRKRQIYFILCLCLYSPMVVSVQVTKWKGCCWSSQGYSMTSPAVNGYSIAQSITCIKTPPKIADRPCWCSSSLLMVEVPGLQPELLVGRCLNLFEKCWGLCSWSC